MVKLSIIRPGANLFGGKTIEVYMRNGQSNRFHHCTMDFEKGREADAFAFCWDADRDLFIHKLETFIDSAANGMSYQWYSQRMWVNKARPQIQELRGYLAQIQRGPLAPEVMAQYAELVELALKKSEPFQHQRGALVLWQGMHDLAVQFVHKYHPEHNKQPKTTAV